MTVTVKKIDRRARPAPQRASSVLPSNHTFVTSLPASIKPGTGGYRSRTPGVGVAALDATSSSASPRTPAGAAPAGNKLPPLAAAGRMQQHRESTVRGLNSAIAFVRTMDEVNKVQQRKMTGKLYVPLVPFGPNTPFVRTRALLGPEHAHLTDPSAAAASSQHGAAPTPINGGSNGATANGAVVPKSAPPSSHHMSQQHRNHHQGGHHDQQQQGHATTSVWKVMKPKKRQQGDDEDDDNEEGDDDDGDDGENVPSPASSPTSKLVKRARSNRTRLPSGPAVADMPRELADGIRSVALDRLRLLFYPRLLRARHRKRLAKESAAALRHAPRVTPELLRKNPLFADWSAEALGVLVSRFVYSSSEQRRVLMYRGEPAGILMAVLMNGSYDLLALDQQQQQQQQQSSGGGDSDAATASGAGAKAKPRRSASVVLARVSAPNVLNEHTFLTAEPRLTTVRLAARSEIWTCDRQGFEAAMAALPPETRAAVLDRAAAKRVRDLPRIYPATVPVLRQLSALAQCSVPFLQALIAIFRPTCFPAGSLLSAASPAAVPSHVTVPTALTLVVRGECGTFRNLLAGPMTNSVVARRFSSAATASAGGDPTRTLISRFRGPCLANEGSALLRVPPSQPNEFIETLSTVDAYVAEADEIERLLASHPSDRQALTAHAQRRLLHQLSAQMMHHRSAVHATPIIGRALPIDAVTALMSLFEARVYAPLSVICGASEPADKIIVLTKGSATIGTGRDRTKWALREAIGYTCVVPHRWAAPVVAQETTETIELSRKYLVAFLEDCGLLKDAAIAARALMFPDAPFPPSCSALIEAARREEAARATRPLYPVYAGITEPSQHLMGMVPVTTAPVTSLLGGMSAALLPSLKRLPLAEREAVEAEVEATFNPEYSRSLVKITQFLWLKQRGV